MPGSNFGQDNDYPDSFSSRFLGKFRDSALKLGYDHFHAHIFQFINLYYPIIRFYIETCLLRASLNKKKAEFLLRT
jgi:hypothetical protein